MLLVARVGVTRAVPPLPRERIIGRHLDGPPARPSVQEMSSRVDPDRGRGWTGRGRAVPLARVPRPGGWCRRQPCTGCAKSEPKVFGVSLASRLQGIAIRRVFYKSVKCVLEASSRRFAEQAETVKKAECMIIGRQLISRLRLRLCKTGRRKNIPDKNHFKGLYA
jgi:hypothetical protein